MIARLNIYLQYIGIVQGIDRFVRLGGWDAHVKYEKKVVHKASTAFPLSQITAVMYSNRVNF